MKFKSLLNALGESLSEKELKIIGKVYDIMMTQQFKLESKAHELESRIKAIGIALEKMEENNERIKKLDSDTLLGE